MTWQAWILAYLLAGFVLEYGAARSMANDSAAKIRNSLILISVWPFTIGLIAWLTLKSRTFKP